MRLIVRVSVALGVLLAASPACPPGRADPGRWQRWQWPLQPPLLTRAFDAPSPDWQRGHRGIDLAGSPGQPVYAAGSATVVFAGSLAGRPVVSIAHPGGLHSSYEPVEPLVTAGQVIGIGQPLGRLLAGHPGCPAPACLHWGAMWGPASRADYVDPQGLLASTPVRLKPVDGLDHAPRAAAPR